MKHMTKRRRIGMIDLSADEFSQSCLPYPTAVIKSISNKLPVVAKKKNDDLLTIIKVTRTTNPSACEVSNHSTLHNGHDLIR